MLPDRVHLTALAGAVGLLAMIIFVAGALGGGGAESAVTEGGTQAPAIDFANSNGAATVLPAATTDGATTTPLTPGGDGTGIAQPPAAASPTAPQTSPIVVQTPSAPEPAPARALDAPATLPTADEAVVHEVVSGDTIYDLAITYDSTIEAILLANGLGDNSTIKHRRPVADSGGAVQRRCGVASLLAGDSNGAGLRSCPVFHCAAAFVIAPLRRPALSCRSAGDRRNDADFITFADGGAQAFEEGGRPHR